MLNIFRRNKITFLDNNWKILKSNVRIPRIPRIYELVYITEKSKYYSVCNIIYNIKGRKCDSVFVIIEEYDDDDALI